MPGQVKPDPFAHRQPYIAPGNRRGSNYKPKITQSSTSSTTRRGSRQTKAEPSKTERKGQYQSESKEKKAVHEEINGKEHEIEEREEPVLKENNTQEDSNNRDFTEENVVTDSHGITSAKDDDQPPVKARTPSPAPPQEPQGFVVEQFNKTMNDFTDVFCANKFTNVTDDYPVEELVAVVNSVTEKIEEFKQQTISSQRHLEELRQRMRDVKEGIRTNIQKKSNAIRVDDEAQSIEERELTEKLAKLNAQVAQANAELADALRISAESESTAAHAQLAAQKAKEEAKNIQEELEFKAKVEERRREQERKRLIEEQKQMEAQKRQEEYMKREKDAEWNRREHGTDQPPVWEAWPTYEYKVKGETTDIGCIIRAHPSKFNQNSVQCTCMDQLSCPVPINVNEELVSSIIQLSNMSQDSAELEEPVVVYIPYLAPRSVGHGHNSREPVVKIEKAGHWHYLETQEESLDNYKDYKFAVCETNLLTKMAVFNRLKRDYTTLSKKGGKVTSSYDQRISINVPKNCIQGKDHVVMEVQPVDSGSVNDMKQKKPECKGLLTSSPIIHMEWENAQFEKPVTVTVPCPPNPVKAKKIAAMRKAKEEKMKNPPKVHVLLPHEIEAMEKEKAKSKLQKMQEQIADEENQKEEPKPTKWYMGEYANVEDDENDNLFLVTSQGPNKWIPVENVNIMQVKLDLLQFDLEKPLEKFMVLRTRKNIQEDTVGNLASEMNKFLSQKFVQVILKQKSDDPFDSVLSVVPTSKTEKTLKKLSEEGYDDGPEPSQELNINEGDAIDVCFRGNITSKEQEHLHFVYNSNLDSETEFTACEVDKYLQKNFPVYRGVVEVYRKYQVKPTTRRKRKDSTEEADENPIETKRELLCELVINIPKYHVEANSTVMKAPITIKNTSDPVDASLLRNVAEELGEEWKTVAGHLNVSKSRVQTISRNLQYGDQSDCDGRYDMLMTWLKKTPKATDKVSCLANALLKSGRGDLAEEIRARDREFRNNHYHK